MISDRLALIEGLLADEFSSTQVKQLISGDPGINTWLYDYACKSKFVRALCRYQQIVDQEGETPSSSIPKTIVQFWNDDLPSDVAPLVDSWKSVPGWRHVIFNDESARSFIKNVYGAEALSAYQYAKHPAFKCDLFRYLYLAEEGGVYIDADEKNIQLKILDDRFRHPISFTAYSWMNSSQNPLGASQGLISISKALSLGVDNSFVSYYFNNSPIGAVAKHQVLQNIALNSVQILTEARSKSEPPNIKTTTHPSIWTEVALAWMVDKGLVNTIDKFSVILDWEDSYVETVWASYKNTPRNWRTL